MAQKSSNTSRKSWQEYAAWVSSFFMTSSSRRWVRNAVVVLLLVVFIWLAYARVYRPLRQDVPLPVSVDRKDPFLDLMMLQAINTQRSERIKRKKPDYFGFSRVFVAPRENE